MFLVVFLSPSDKHRHSLRVLQRAKVPFITCTLFSLMGQRGGREGLMTHRCRITALVVTLNSCSRPTHQPLWSNVELQLNSGMCHSVQAADTLPLCSPEVMVLFVCFCSVVAKTFIKSRFALCYFLLKDNCHRHIHSYRFKSSPDFI